MIFIGLSLYLRSYNRYLKIVVGMPWCWKHGMISWAWFLLACLMGLIFYFAFKNCGRYALMLKAWYDLLIKFAFHNHKLTVIWVHFFREIRKSRVFALCLGGMNLSFKPSEFFKLKQLHIVSTGLTSILKPIFCFGLGYSAFYKHAYGKLGTIQWLGSSSHSIYFIFPKDYC